MKARWIIEAARTKDGPAIGALLREAGLPHDDFAAHLGRFLVARDETGVVIGAVGAEVMPPDALLRSLVVAPAWRGIGLGDELVRRIDAAAADWGVQRWWLLTNSAEVFLASRGFVAMRRDEAPGAIRATGQFRGGCDRTAVCMTRARKVGS